MKKKKFRERYVDNIVKIETFEDLIPNPKPVEVIEEKPKRGRKKKEEVEEKTVKRGRKSVKSDK